MLGFVLNDGTPLRSVEVKVDDGSWQPAALESSNTKYSWKLFTYAWKSPAAGEHTLVSRVTDIKGNVTAGSGGSRQQEEFPRGQRAVSAQGDDRLRFLREPSDDPRVGFAAHFEKRQQMRDGEQVAQPAAEIDELELAAGRLR